MLKLMRLELKRNNLKTYVAAGAVICFVMTGFLFLFAYAPRIAADPDLQIFTGYQSIIPLFSVLNMAVFATLSSVVLAKFVIEEYKGKRVILLFSYPIKRDRILFAKLAVAFLFTLAAMTACNLFAFGVVGISERIFPLVEEALSGQMVLRVAKVTLILAVTAAAIGILATGIGFIKKSVPSAIVSAVLLSSVCCNILFRTLGNDAKSDTAAIVFMLVVVLAGLVAVRLLTVAVNRMEAE